MYIYQDIAFRVIEKKDLDVLREIHNDSSTFLNLYNIDLVDEHDQFAWWENLHKKSNDRRYVICFVDNPNEIIGRLRIQNINALHNNCEIGLDIRKEYRRQGFATKSYHMLLEYLFEHLNMHMVYVRVADFNPNAKKLYTKIGFVESGRLLEYFYRHGKYWDYLIMCLTKIEYLDIQKRAKHV